MAGAGAPEDGHAVAEEALRITKALDQPGLIIAGEVDESGYPLLLQSLAALGHHGDVHIDLGGIEFCDLAGLRAIRYAGRPGEDASPGRQVCLHAIPPRLRKIMQILGWDDGPGLAFDAQPLSGEDQQAGQGPNVPASGEIVRGQERDAAPAASRCRSTMA